MTKLQHTRSILCHQRHIAKYLVSRYLMTCDANEIM